PIYIAEGGSKSMIRYISEKGYLGYYKNLDPQTELRYPQDFFASIAVLSSLANSSMPRDLLLRCGGFDEDILAAEDLELGLRMWRLGVPFRFRPSAIVHEFYVKTSNQYLRGQAVALGSGDLRACRKHPEYRPYSSLSSFGETPVGKRWLRNLIMRFPVSPVRLLSLPLYLEEHFYRFPSLRSIGERLFLMSERITRLRSGLVSVGSWQKLKEEYDRQVPCLIYHHVGPAQPGAMREWTISPEQFERQIGWLADKGYVGIRPSDWQCWRRDGTGLPSKPVLITLDDAYADTAEFALPILKRYGFGAGVFVVTARIGRTNTWDEAQGSGTLHLMTAEQIRSWSGQGIEFGAHSRTHADLTQLTTQELNAEVKGSKDDLAALLGTVPTAFAYPFGCHSEAVCKAVRKEFDLAFGSEEGMNYLRTDPYLLHRVPIGPATSLWALSWIVRRGGLQQIRDWRVRVGLRTRVKRALGLN
ncbi:MAG: polysaccharide deacetylase family protein, partial [Silvibacterium sp.]